MKNYPTSKEILEKCDGDRVKASLMSIEYMKEVLTEALKSNYNIPEDINDKLDYIEESLRNLINKKL